MNTQKRIPSIPGLGTTGVAGNAETNMIAVDPEVVKEVWRQASLRRKQNGVKRKMIRMYAEESQAIAFSELWESYVLRWGKTGALDHLIRLMALVEARLRDKERAETR